MKVFNVVILKLQVTTGGNHRLCREELKIIKEDSYFIVNPFPHCPWEAAQPTARGLIGPLYTVDVMLIKDASDDVMGADWTLPYLLSSHLSVL